MVKMEIRNTAGGLYGSELLAFGIYNCCEKAIQLERPYLFEFSLKRPLCDKIFEILFKDFSPPHQSTLLCSNVIKFV